MNPLDALDPNITDERLAESYGESFGIVSADCSIVDIRNGDRIWAHQWFTDLMLQIQECKCEDKMSCDCLSDWDRIPTKLSDLLLEVKRLREAIVDMIDSMDNYYIRDIQHATECLRDVIGYYEDDEE